MQCWVFLICISNTFDLIFTQLFVMKILELVEIHNIIPGGSTKPLLISAIDEKGEIKEYVMKLYSNKYVKQNYSIAKEIFVSELAKEFDLPVPDYGLIDIDLDLLNDYYTDTELSNFDRGLKFCSEFKGQYVIFNPLTSKKYMCSYEIANLYAFDSTIGNTDRGGFRKKPNLLVNDSEILLIDHEQTLPFIDNYDREINYYTYLRSYQYQVHIVRNYLCSLSNNDKNGMFDEFSETINRINLRKFEKLFNDFDAHNVIYGNREQFFIFLRWVKNNNNSIVKHISNTI